MKNLLCIALASILLPSALAHADTVVVSDSDGTVDWNYPLVTSGATTFAISYGAAVIVGATNDGRGDQDLYIPLLGPWLALADRGSCDATLQACDHETATKVLFVVDGVFQAAGLLTILEGVLSSPYHHHAHYADDRKVHFTPVAMSHGEPGLAVFGRF